MQVELKNLKERYVNLWFKGLLANLCGLINMYALVSEASNIFLDKDVSWMIAFYILNVALAAHLSIAWKTRRNIIFDKIKPHLNKG